MSSIIQQPRYSCALASVQTVLAIPGAFPIVHAGPGCASNVTSNTGRFNGHQTDCYAGGYNITSTNTYEQEVVFGGEPKLRETIKGALQVLKGDLFVVLTGCTADIVGDDSVSVAKEFAENGHPVVGAETAGFKGNNYYGHEVVVNAIIDQFTGETAAAPRKGLVNVFSVVPYQDPFWRGDLQTLKSLLESIGLEVNILFGYESSGVTEWKDIPNAQFNLLVSPWVGLSTVKLLEQKYGTPFLHYPILPVGAGETNAFLRTVGEFAGLDQTLVEKVVKEQETRFYKYLMALLEFMSDFQSNLPVELYTVADSAYALGVSSFLVNEIGFILKGVYIIDDPPAAYLKPILNSAVSLDGTFTDNVHFETDGGLIQQDISKKLGGSKKALFLGSGWEKLLAQATNNLYTFISSPLPETVIVNQSFLGYEGGLRLVEEIYSNVFKTKNVTPQGNISHDWNEQKKAAEELVLKT
jgi:nitrogenase molybdenum-iron protein beta chain